MIKIWLTLFACQIRRRALPPSMAPGRGGRGGRGSPEDVVVMDGRTLRRVFDDATKSWVYRPVDETSGKTISNEDFESRRASAAASARASDPTHRAAEEKRWLDDQRVSIREKRVDVAKAARRDDFHAAVRDGLVERRRPRRAVLAHVPIPVALTELREEMRVATLRDTQKKNPGRFAFIKTALDSEEAKFGVAVEKARREAYDRERAKKGVRGGAGEAESSDSDADAGEERPLFRGSAADADDPDYRRGPASAGGGRGGGGAAVLSTGGRDGAQGGRGRGDTFGGRGSGAPAGGGKFSSEKNETLRKPNNDAGPTVPAPRDHGRGRGGRGGRGRVGGGREGTDGGGRGGGVGHNAQEQHDDVYVSVPKPKKEFPAPKPAAQTAGEHLVTPNQEGGPTLGGRGRQRNRGGRGRGRGGGRGSGET